MPSELAFNFDDDGEADDQQLPPLASQLAHRPYGGSGMPLLYITPFLLTCLPRADHPHEPLKYDLQLRWAISSHARWCPAAARRPLSSK